MRSIKQRNGGGYHLEKAHSHPPTSGEQAKSRWDHFRYKNEVLQYFLDDQFGLCCYSELRADLEGLGYHIDHIQPKSSYPGLTFEYGNLAASALTSDDLKSFKIVREDAFGGHAKQSQYDARFISCLDADSARYFAYLSDGRVVPRLDLNENDTDRAIYTIAVLNLNCGYLTNRRRSWFEELEVLFEQHQEKNWSLDDLASIHLIPTNHRLHQFFSLTRNFFGPRAESVLMEYAPELI